MTVPTDYDYRRDWPEEERREWTAVTGRIWHNPSTNTVRLTMSGEWPDQAAITNHTMVVERTVAGRLMQVDIHGLNWD
jgi:hypothetical protein